MTDFRSCEQTQQGAIPAADADAQQMRELGLATEFARDMSPWANFPLGFTYLSPVVGVYTLFAFALATAGPPMIWSFRTPGVARYDNWIVALSGLVAVATGLLYLVVGRPYLASDQPHVYAVRAGARKVS